MFILLVTLIIFFLFLLIESVFLFIFNKNYSSLFNPFELKIDFAFIPDSNLLNSSVFYINDLNLTYKNNIYYHKNSFHFSSSKNSTLVDLLSCFEGNAQMIIFWYEVISNDVCNTLFKAWLSNSNIDNHLIIKDDFEKLIIEYVANKNNMNVDLINKYIESCQKMTGNTLINFDTYIPENVGKSIILDSVVYHNSSFDLRKLIEHTARKVVNKSEISMDSSSLPSNDLKRLKRFYSTNPQISNLLIPINQDVVSYNYLINFILSKPHHFQLHPKVIPFNCTPAKPLSSCSFY